MLIFFAFCGAYGYLCKKSLNFTNDGLKLGIAGSLANMLCECSFHFVDTLNIRIKVDENKNKWSKSTIQNIKSIYKADGISGFGKGISACFYGSLLWGVTYFILYKNIK